MVKVIFALILAGNLLFSFHAGCQIYPADVQLTYNALPSIPRPGYLSPIRDITFNSTVIRISDQEAFNKHNSNLKTYHHYAKNQPWNSNGTLIKLEGSPAAILDGKTFVYVKSIVPPSGPYVWANTQPDIMYGTDKNNTIVKVNVSDGKKTVIKKFSEYTFVSLGEYEGNLSNDDRYMALQCRSGSAMFIVCYDLVTDKVVSAMKAPVWPNNCAVTQSGNYVIVQWDVDGPSNYQGVCAYNRKDMSFVRNLTTSGGGHYDYGYDIKGNEVMVGSDKFSGSGTARIGMVRIDNGEIVYLLAASQMSWAMHISCRNSNRPGWAYITDFAESYSEPTKPNYQKIFAVKLDPSANENALTETFAHTHHSTRVKYECGPFGVPNRDGSKVMWRSDWDNPTGEINSYVAYLLKSLNEYEPGESTDPPQQGK